MFVYLARKQGLKPHETTGALLDEAARVANEPPPGLATEEIREMLDPVKFLQRHNNVGDPHPDETRRLISVRREALKDAAERQMQRRQRLAESQEKLSAAIAAIPGERE